MSLSDLKIVLGEVREWAIRDHPESDAHLSVLEVCRQALDDECLGELEIRAIVRYCYRAAMALLFSAPQSHLTRRLAECVTSISRDMNLDPKLLHDDVVDHHVPEVRFSATISAAKTDSTKDQLLRELRRAKEQQLSSTVLPEPSRHDGLIDACVSLARTAILSVADASDSLVHHVPQGYILHSATGGDDPRNSHRCLFDVMRMVDHIQHLASCDTELSWRSHPRGVGFQDALLVRSSDEPYHPHYVGWWTEDESSWVGRHRRIRELFLTTRVLMRECEALGWPEESWREYEWVMLAMMLYSTHRDRRLGILFHPGSYSSELLSKSVIEHRQLDGHDDERKAICDLRRSVSILHGELESLHIDSTHPDGVKADLHEVYVPRDVTYISEDDISNVLGQRRSSWHSHESAAWIRDLVSIGCSYPSMAETQEERGSLDCLSMRLSEILS